MIILATGDHVGSITILKKSIIIQKYGLKKILLIKLFDQVIFIDKIFK